MSAPAGPPLRRDTAFDRWGEPGSTPALPASAERLLGERLGELTAAGSTPLEAVELPDAPPLSERVIAAAGGPETVSSAAEDRIRHATGSSYPDLIRLRSGSLERAPDAVAAPATPDAVAALLEACAAERVAVVPFGGGTSVVGGVEPERAGFERLIALDTVALRGCEIDRISRTARLGAGLRGPEAEAALGAAGYTLGHFPQSFRYATIGGFAATRSAGQASAGYGRFDSLVSGFQLATPSGVLSSQTTPHSAAGPSLRELALGSEGTFGAFTEVEARVRPAPERRAHQGWFAEDFSAGIAAIRELAQAGELPDVVRLSDPEESEVNLALSGFEGPRKRALEGYLRLRGRAGGCLLIAGWEGGREAVARRLQLARRRLRRSGAVSLGSAPGRAWERGRYEGPHLRDALLDRGVLVETLETAHSYSRLGELYERVRGALRTALRAAGAGEGVVMCHVSHAYADGASLYFTFLGRARAGEEIDQWRVIKAAACEAIVAAGGTITHHHAVGRDHAPYMEAEVGALGIEALRAVKGRLDPAGIMNPGKLLAG